MMDAIKKRPEKKEKMNDAWESESVLIMQSSRLIVTFLIELSMMKKRY